MDSYNYIDLIGAQYCSYFTCTRKHEKYKYVLLLNCSTSHTMFLTYPSKSSYFHQDHSLQNRYNNSFHYKICYNRYRDRPKNIAIIDKSILSLSPNYYIVDYIQQYRCHTHLYLYEPMQFYHQHTQCSLHTKASVVIFIKIIAFKTGTIIASISIITMLVTFRNTVVTLINICIDVYEQMQFIYDQNI